MPRTIALWDDGKGRTTVRREADAKPDTVMLIAKDDWRKAILPGEYGWESYDVLETIVLNCPFCGFSTPIPWTVIVKEREPLTLEESLYCIRCETSFYVIAGKAMRSWGVLEAIPLLGNPR